MKVSPVSAEAPRPVNIDEGSSASAARIARAKAVATGQTPPEPVQAQQAVKAENTLKRIKLRTQMSTNRHQVIPSEEPPAPEPVAAAPIPEGDALAPIEQAAPATEETKPISPQFAALARQKRELQVREKAFADREAAFQAKESSMLDGYVSKADIKANALKIVLEQGVTYDDLTAQILANNQGGADLSQYENRLKAMEESFDKKLADRDTQVEEQVFSKIESDVDQLIGQGTEDYEMIREAGYQQKVKDLIRKTWQTKREALSAEEAADLIESELLSDSLKFAAIKKVQKQLGTQAAPAQQQQQPVQSDRPPTKIMRTLTNRDGSSSLSMDKRERAIAAMEGRLIK